MGRAGGLRRNGRRDGLERLVRRVAARGRPAPRRQARRGGRDRGAVRPRAVGPGRRPLGGGRGEGRGGRRGARRLPPRRRRHRRAVRRRPRVDRLRPDRADGGRHPPLRARRGRGGATRRPGRAREHRGRGAPRRAALALRGAPRRRLLLGHRPRAVLQPRARHDGRLRRAPPRHASQRQPRHHGPVRPDDLARRPAPAAVRRHRRLARHRRAPRALRLLRPAHLRAQPHVHDRHLAPSDARD